MKIILGCQKDDELQNLCKNFFGSENIEILNRNGILSLDELAIIISITSLTVDTISFLYTVLADWKSKRDLDRIEDTNSSINAIARRVIITKEGDINLEGYSFEEVERIVRLLEEKQNDR